MAEIQATLPLYTWRKALESWAASDEPGILKLSDISLLMGTADARGARLLLELIAANPDLTGNDIEQLLFAALSWNRLMIAHQAAERELASG